MLRRVLPVAGAAALVLIPSSAWAVPDSGPVFHYAYQGYFATFDAGLPDGRHVSGTLSRYGADPRDSSGSLVVQVQQPCVVGGICAPPAYGFAELSGDQVEIDRGLRAASVKDVSVTLTTPSYLGPDGPPTDEVSVSVELTGTGTVTRSAEHILADYCGGDSTGCQSTGVGASRAADVTLTLEWVSGETDSGVSGTGLLTYDQSVNNATPSGAH